MLRYDREVEWVGADGAGGHDGRAGAAPDIAEGDVVGGGGVAGGDYQHGSRALLNVAFGKPLAYAAYQRVAVRRGEPVARVAPRAASGQRTRGGLGTRLGRTRKGGDFTLEYLRPGQLREPVGDAAALVYMAADAVAEDEYCP